MPNYAYQQTAQNIFCQIKSVDDLADLLKCQVFALEFFAQNPSYNEFKVPKKKGGFRLIEDPDVALKDYSARAKLLSTMLLLYAADFGSVCFSTFG